MLNGEPPAPGPSAEVALYPSSTIEVIPLLSDGLIRTLRCTTVLPEAGTVSPVQVATPSTFVPPLSADTKLVFAGIGSVILTPVAAPFPMLRTVIA